MVVSGDAEVRVAGQEEITLKGRRVVLLHADVPATDVHLNPQNPRVGYVTKLLGNQATQDQIREHLWGLPSVKSLARSIKSNGGLIERTILQRRDGDGYLAWEGNCRATIYSKFHEQEPDEEAWARLPARILPDDVDPRDVMWLLGDFHVAGKNEWVPFEKASYIYRMLEEFAFDPADLATLLRMSKSTLYQFRNAYKWMINDYLPKFPDPDRVRDFSHFLEFEKRLKDATSELKAEFTEWVGNRLFGMAIYVRDLPTILATPGAKEVLAKEGYEAAMEVVAEKHPERTSRLFAALAKATRQLRGATFEEIDSLRSGDSAKVAQLRELHRSLSDLAQLAGVELET